MTSVMGMTAYVKQELDAYEYQGDDLIAGVTPTLVDWTNDPTDAADITDGDISTFCTTGDKVAGSGYQYAYFEWDLGEFHNVIYSGMGSTAASAGEGRIYVLFWDGSAWVGSYYPIVRGSAGPFVVLGAMCSKIRVGVLSTLAATITPNIREFHVWRV